MSAALASCVSELHAGHGSLTLKKSHDSRQEFDVSVAPDSQVLGANASFGRHGGGLRENQACSADRSAPEVHEVPVIRKTVVTRILTHRRNDDAISQRNATNRKRIK